MFSHKIVSKEEQANGTFELGVEFTDGAKTFTEKIIPQDKEGFKYWLDSRLKSLNSLDSFRTEVTIGDPVDLTEPEIVLTPEEIAQKEWVEKYRKWVRIKTTLIDTGVLTGNETQVQNFLQDVKDGFKPEYINFI